MYSYKDLFDIRSNVGAKLTEYIKAKEITKSKLCQDAGISRPTLDKILNGTIGSMVNYERHIEKIFDSLNITPDILFGKTTIKRNNIRALRKLQNEKIDYIAECTGISENRLRAIEAGEEPTLAELRDLAALLNTNTLFLTGENVFDAQVSLLNYFFEHEDSDDLGYNSGFWGHVGILPVGSKLYHWFPITGNVRNQIYDDIDSLEYLIIPCMNNKLLFLNMANIKQIRLLDEACDEPVDANWDSDVDFGEIPPVIYEALEDYDRSDDDSNIDDTMSPKFRELIKRFLEMKKWDEDDIWDLWKLVLHYRDGEESHFDIDLDRSYSLLTDIDIIYSFKEDECIDHWFWIENMESEEICINIDQIAMMELPLVQVERAICKMRKEEE